MRKKKEAKIWAEMARRKKEFYPNTEWHDIQLWGLFKWDEVSSLIKQSKLLTHMRKENEIVYVRPSLAAYKEHIEPLLKQDVKTLTRKAAW
jgi:hypothetical protein